MKFIVVMFIVIFGYFTEVAAQSITKVVDINPHGGSYPMGFFTFHNRLYFMASDTSESVENHTLWSTDGTSTGTVHVDDHHPLAITIFNDNIYIYANDGKNNFGLWKNDGLPGSTTFVKLLNTVQSYTGEFSVFNERMYFSAHDSGRDNELWSTDGTDTGTYLIKNINLSGSSFPSHFMTLRDRLYFFAIDSSKQYGLWESDGSSSGTMEISDICPSASINEAPHLARLNDNLFFVALSPSRKYDLWKSDGSIAGTQPVITISGPGSSVPSDFTMMNNKLYFIAEDSSGGRALWETEGNASSTLVIQELIPLGSNSFLSGLTAYNNTLYFTKSDNYTGTEPWVSDGTAAGTKRLLIINQQGSRADANPGGYTPFKNKIYFTATDGTGEAVYVTDGTAENTFALSPDSLHDFSSHPFSISSGFKEFNNRLYFAAGYDYQGVELWAISDNTNAVRKEGQSDNEIAIHSCFAHSTLQVDIGKPTTVIIFNVLGVLVDRCSLRTSGNIDVSSLGSGIYFIRSLDNAFSAKFIKE